MQTCLLFSLLTSHTHGDRFCEEQARPARSQTYSGRRGGGFCFCHQPATSSPFCFNIQCPPTLSQPSEVSKKHSHPTNSLGASWDSFQSLL